MKLLIITQKVNENDPILGFFHEWIKEFAKRYEIVTVLCLEKGKHNLPANVAVFSLGKENGPVSRFRYAARFYRVVWKERRQYDRVFVHMNGEYVLLAGLLWRAMGKRVALWRNHVSGGCKAWLAVQLSHIVFCTSTASYTARFSKTEIMPVGISETIFKNTGVPRDQNSILYVGRISRIKNIDCLIDACGLLRESGFTPSVHLYGPVFDPGYFRSLNEKINASNLKSTVMYHGTIKPALLPEVYSKYGICVNMTNSGSFDKTILESIFCGTFPVVSNTNLRELLPDQRSQQYILFGENNPPSLAKTLKLALSLSAADRAIISEKLLARSKETHGLTTLIDKLVACI